MMAFIGCGYASSASEKKEKTTFDLNKIKNKAHEAQIFCKLHKYNTEFCFLADMGLHSGVRRFFVWNFKTDTISNSYLVGHGCGDSYWSYDFTKENPSFSNEANSHCTSLGKYKIGERGYSNWGIHVKYFLHGLDETNSKALERQIVLHSWDAMPNVEVYPNGAPEGWGCPTLSNEAMIEVDKKLQNSKNPVLLWMFE